MSDTLTEQPSADVVAQIMQARLAKMTTDLVLTRQMFVFDPQKPGIYSDQLRFHGADLVAQELWLHLYSTWVNHGPQTAVKEAFLWMSDDPSADEGRAFPRAISHVRRRAAISWFSTNKLEIQSVEISWPEVMLLL